MSPDARSPLVKLVAGLLCPAGDELLREWAEGRMTCEFGPIERSAGPWRWDYTDYYADISPELERRFYSFKGLIEAGRLPGLKLAAIGIERESAPPGGSRRVNIDPGYVDRHKLVLASTKDNAQRLYLAGGIYAEITLMRRRAGWSGMPGTFPDFHSGVYDGFLDMVREDVRRELKIRIRGG